MLNVSQFMNYKNDYYVPNVSKQKKPTTTKNIQNN